MSDKTKTHTSNPSISVVLFIWFTFSVSHTLFSQIDTQFSRLELKKLTNKGNYVKASEVLGKLNNEKLKTKNARIYYYLMKSDYFLASNRTDSSGRYLQLAKKSITLRTPDSLKAYVEFELGQWYTSINDFENSYASYKIAMDLFDKTNNMDSYIKATGNFGILSFLTGDTTKAIQIFQKILHRSKQKGEKLNCAIAHQNIGRFFLTINNLDSAKYHFQASIDTKAKYQTVSYLPNTYRGLAEISIIEGKPQDAIKYYEKAIVLYKQIGHNSTTLDAILKLKDVYKATGDIKKALELSERSIDLKSEIYEENRAKSIGITQAELMDIEKSAKIHLLRSGLELEKSKTLLLLLAGVIVLIILVFVYLKLKDQRKKRTLENKAYLNQEQINLLENEKLRNELELGKKAITAESLRLIEKNDQIQLLRDKIGELSKSLPDKYADEINSLSTTFRTLLRVEHSWEEFLLYFKEVHPDAHRVFDNFVPSLTLKEKRLLSLIYLELNTKEISKITGISPDSVKKARTRLRKKLSLEENDSIRQFIVDLMIELEVSVLAKAN